MFVSRDLTNDPLTRYARKKLGARHDDHSGRLELAPARK